MKLFSRARTATVLGAVVLTMGLAGQVPASAAESGVVAAGYPVIAIEQYCGPTGTIKDPTRNGTLYQMVYITNERSRNYYDAYGPSGFFKRTANLC